MARKEWFYDIFIRKSFAGSAFHCKAFSSSSYRCPLYIIIFSDYRKAAFILVSFYSGYYKHQANPRTCGTRPPMASRQS